MALYSDIVMDHFMHPRNVGEIENPDGVGQVGNAKCGDIMKMYLKIRDNVIQDVKFETFGCGSAIASSSMATEMIKGKTIDQALAVTNRQVVDALGGLPAHKLHCSVLAEESIKSAIKDYYDRHGIEYDTASSRRTAAPAKAAGWCNMVISSKGRYALRVMVDLAEHGGDGYVSMRDVARRQEISDKYAGQIMTLLSRAGLVDGVTGKGGGYRLTRQPQEYPLGEILRLTEGSLAPVACLEEGAHPCDRAARCRTLPVWNRLGQLIGDYLDSVTLRDLLKTDE